MKLGKGELVQIFEDGSSLSLNDARDYFFLAVKEVAPDVLDDLAGEPFTLYKAAGLAFDRKAFKKDIEDLEFADQIREMTRAETRHTWNHPDWDGHFENHEIDYDPNPADLQKCIFAWSKRHNLDAAWCRSLAFETLDYWHKYPELCQHRIWYQPSSLQTIVPVRNGLEFQFRIRSLYPSVSFRKDEKERITAHFERELAIFLDMRERLAEENGMVRPKHRPDEQHFIWFAYYQVKGLSHDAIRLKFGRSREAVRDAINNVRGLLSSSTDPTSELNRPIKPGRPRKN